MPTILRQKYAVSDDEDFVILAYVIMTQHQRVTDRQTDRQTHMPTAWL